MSKSDRVYGIDLGTTYSCIAYVDENGKPVVVPNSEGQLTTPSVVYFESPGNTVVGKTAKESAEMYPSQVVSTVKRSIGNPDWIFEYEGETYRPEDISSFILRKLVNDAQVNTGDEISDVVITCPAYFGLTQKEATKQAGILAGLNVRYIIPEPTAAAIAYGIDQSTDQVILVFDLGGGTFDVTVLEVKADAINVICTGGDHDLGGKDWDGAIASWFAEQFSDKTGIPAENLTNDMETWGELINSAENAKISLSSRESYTQRVRYDAERAAIELTREKFNELTNHLLERTISLTEELLETAKDKGYDKIDKILLVGGSTYMPQVIEAVKARFPFDVHQFDPNQAVAKGAALFGFKSYLDDQLKAHIAGQTGVNADEVDMEQVPEEVRANAEQAVAQEQGMALPGLKKLTQTEIRNVTSKSFGIVVVNRDGNEVVTNLIKINDTVPVTYSQRFGTYEEGQEGVILKCVENSQNLGPDDPSIPWPSTEEEQEMAGLKMIGSAELRFQRPLPQGSPVEIIFSLSEDGLLTVHGKDLTTDQEAAGKFNTAAVMTAEEVEEKKSRNMSITVS